MQAHMARMFGSVFAVLVLLGVGTSEMQAQDQAPAVKGKQLPPYFKDVVSQEQKNEIYKIKVQYDQKLAGLQQQYDQLNEQLKLVRKAIDELEKDEDAAIESVLTAEQLAKVKKKYAEAQARRAAAALKAAEAAAQAAAVATGSE